MTTTAGAASELLSPALTDEAVDIAVALSVQFPTMECPLILDIVRAALVVQHKRNTPAPVTEGAQREAVASPFVFNEELSAKLQDLRADMPKEAKDALVRECIALLREHQNKIDPPPPDRVQPERVEADEIGKLLAKLDAGAETRDDCDVFWAAGNCIRKLLNAPPNDASGGVTED